MQILASLVLAVSADIRNPGLIEPTRCETCKYFTLELSQRLLETGSKKEILQTGHGLDRKKKEIKYATSELRLIESLEDICDAILEYNMHKERTGSLRFAKGESQTMETLKSLKERGVQVDLGIPDEMWDEPSAEVTQMKKECESILENSEEHIEDWYFNHQETDIQDFICRQKVLELDDQACLDEEWTGTELVHEEEVSPADENRDEL